MRVGEEPNFRVSALALTANIPGAAYFMLINHFQKRYLSSEATVAIVQTTTTLTYVVLAIIFEDAKFDMTDQGLGGFLRKENFVICVFVYAFMAGFWGS